MELFLESFSKIFISGIIMTLPLALVSFIIAMLLAIVCAMIQYAKVPIAKNIVQFYIWIFRGTPMLVQLFIMYFGMQSIGVRISAITAAIIVFSLNTTRTNGSRILCRNELYADYDAYYFTTSFSKCFSIFVQ